MADPSSLSPYNWFSIIIRYAENFGLDPDYVFMNSSWGTVLDVLTYKKVSNEFQERFDYFYHELTKKQDKK